MQRGRTKMLDVFSMVTDRLPFVVRDPQASDDIEIQTRRFKWKTDDRLCNITALILNAAMQLINCGTSTQ